MENTLYISFWKPFTRQLVRQLLIPFLTITCISFGREKFVAIDKHDMVLSNVLIGDKGISVHVPGKANNDFVGVTYPVLHLSDDDNLFIKTVGINY
jgi:hypothetical protein